MSSLGISGSKGEGGPPPEQLFPQRPAVTERAPNAKLATYVYLDATTSMQGFVASGDSQYLSFLREIGIGLTAAWPGSPEPLLFKFGSTVKAIAGPAYRTAAAAAFYHDPDVSRQTRIDLAFAKIAPDALSIIVTDLFQQDVDVPVMLRSLQTKLQQNRFSVGIWALRSQFRGRAYDVGLTAANVDCESTTNPDTFRPFYLLIVGREADVRKFVDTVRNKTTASPKDNIVLLTPDVADALLNWSKATITRESVKESSRIVRGAAAVNYRAFSLNNGQQLANIEAEVEYAPAPFTPAVDFSKAKPLIEAKSFRDGKTSAGAQQNLSVRLQVAGKAKARLSATFDPKGLPPGVYAYQITPTFGADAFELPGWCSAWSIKESGTVANSETVACIKTQNLDEFVGSLWTVMVQTNPPKPASFYLYFLVSGDS